MSATSAAERVGPLVGVGDVVAATGLDEDTVRGHLDRGEWPGVRVGVRRVWRMPPAVITHLLAGRDPAELRTPAAAG